jgi:CHAD domain-containing protein
VAAVVKHLTQKAAPHPPAVKALADEPVTTHEIIERAIKGLAAQVDRLLAGEPEAIHQYRIALRRMRAVLELFQPLLPQKWLSHHRDELKAVAQAVGALRDSDVLRQNLLDASAEIEPSLRDGLAPLQDSLAERRHQQHEQVCALLKSQSYAALIQQIAAAPVKELKSSGGNAVLSELLQPLVLAVGRSGARLNRDSNPSEFHRLRIRIKRLRYALEMVNADQGKSARRSLTKLKKLQAQFGLQHDSVTAMTWLREFVASAAAPAQTMFAAGAVYQVLHRRSPKLARRAAKKWKVVCASMTLKRLMSGLPDNLRVTHLGKVEAA